MTKIIFTLWPVLIPLAIYLGWMIYCKKFKKDIKINDEFFAKQRRMRFLALVATGVIILIFIVFFGVFAEDTKHLLSE